MADVIFVVLVLIGFGLLIGLVRAVEAAVILEHVVVDSSSRSVLLVYLLVALCAGSGSDGRVAAARRPSS